MHMNIGIFTDTYEPQINGVVTSIQSSVEFLSKPYRYVFCPNVKPKIKSTKQYGDFHQLFTPFKRISIGTTI